MTIVTIRNPWMGIESSGAFEIRTMEGIFTDAI